MDPRAEQRLVGVDVPDAGDVALVEQERLDRRPAPAARRRSVAPSSAPDERLEPQAGAEEGVAGRDADGSSPVPKRRGSQKRRSAAPPSNAKRTRS